MMVVRAGTRLTALIGLQPMTLAIGASGWVACINRWTSTGESRGLCRPVVPQWSEHGVGVVQIAGSCVGAYASGQHPLDNGLSAAYLSSRLVGVRPEPCP